MPQNVLFFSHKKLPFQRKLFVRSVEGATTLSITTFSIMTFSIMTFSITINKSRHSAECCYADCHLCRVAFMLSATSKLYMLSVVRLNVFVLNVVMLNVVAPCGDKLLNASKQIPMAQQFEQIQKNWKFYITLFTLAKIQVGMCLRQRHWLCLPCQCWVTQHIWVASLKSG